MDVYTFEKPYHVVPGREGPGFGTKNKIDAGGRRFVGYDTKS